MTVAITSSPYVFHPARGLAESEGSRQTQSTNCYQSGTTNANERDFRVAIRFFDENEAEFSCDSARGATASERLARKCRVRRENAEGFRRDVTSAPQYNHDHKRQTR
jgi:hypothetical protein